MFNADTRVLAAIGLPLIELSSTVEKHENVLIVWPAALACDEILTF